MRKQLSSVSVNNDAFLVTISFVRQDATLAAVATTSTAAIVVGEKGGGGHAIGEVRLGDGGRRLEHGGGWHAVVGGERLHARHILGVVQPQLDL